MLQASIQLWKSVMPVLTERCVDLEYESVRVLSRPLALVRLVCNNVDRSTNSPRRILPLILSGMGGSGASGWEERRLVRRLRWPP